MQIKGKVAIVTGASGGIGEAVARALSAAGARIVLVARSKEKLDKLAGEILGSLVVVADMSRPAEIKKMIATVVKHFGTVDILVNNAGRGYDAGLEFMDIGKYHELFDLDVVGPVVAMQAVIPVMRKAGGGAIVNISSGTALMTLPNMSGYSSLKRALVGLSLTAREELKKDNIAVTVVYPTMTATDFEANTMKGKEVSWEWSGGGSGRPQADSASYVADKIVAGIVSGVAEVFAHDRMRPK